MDFDKLLPTNLYHSYVIEGGEDIAYVLREFLESKGYIKKQSGDVLLNIYDSFTILDSHSIKEWHMNLPIDGRKKVCIIGTKFINREAEQALLKIIEEPNIDTHFFIIIPDSSLLLNTILSRVHVIKNNNLSNNLDYDRAKEFLSLSPSTRIVKIAEIIKEFKDEESSGGLRYNAISLLNGLERIIYEKWKKDINNRDYKFILEEIKNNRNYLSTPGASVKMILEHVALMI